MQTRVERFIDDVALRRTMLRAHRQAWCWQDEWVGLQMADIRRLERETQAALQKLDAGETEVDDRSSETGGTVASVDHPASTTSSSVAGKLPRQANSNQSFHSSRSARSASLASAESSMTVHASDAQDHSGSSTASIRTRTVRRRATKLNLCVTHEAVGEVHLEEEMALLRMDAIEVGSASESDSDSDVYYDAQQGICGLHG